MSKCLLAFISFSFLLCLSSQAQIFNDCFTTSGAVTSGFAAGITVQQSIGQGSVIGNFKSEKLTVRQGFLQPNIHSHRSGKNKAIDVEVFPNPFSEIVQVQFRKASEEVIQLRIFSIDGSLLRSFENRMDGTIQLDLSGLAQGLYILQVDSVQGLYATKIQKL